MCFTRVFDTLIALSLIAVSLSLAQKRKRKTSCYRYETAFMLITFTQVCELNIIT
uniref:G-protein coupled receptors family 1 profile domain-containing protein n=1 Tax=Anguilla anguilla TaxID=7936 RepID=A0A0E9UIQ8_ANGAN